MARSTRIGGGIRKYLPLRERTEERPNPHPTWWYPYLMLDPHEQGNWHKVSPSGMPRVSWAIYRIRRTRLGQLKLFSTFTVKA